jgi:long-chain acyl-CoA synthetase
MPHRNLADMLQHQAERNGAKTAIRFKRDATWHDVSYAKYRADALACAAALMDAGVGKDERVGVLAENSVEWLLADMGILTAGAINVPLHSPLTARQVHFQLAETETCWMFVSNREQLEKIRQIRRELPALRGIVVFDAKASGGDAVAWTEFLSRGRDALKRLAAAQAERQASIQPDDLCTIVYTSGTTGNPKGAMLSHGNIISNVAASQEASPHEPHTVLLSWLPYSHIYARTVDHYLSIFAGTAIAVAESPETVVQNLAEIQPTHLTAVPRFYEKVLAAVADPNPEIIGKKLRHIFGPKIEWLSAGGAALSRPVGEAYTAAGLPMFQGYGLTETSPVITFNRKGANKLGTVGRVLPGIEMKINPDGEILTRGPHVMKGYWRNAEATAESIRDGWFHTGDIGSVDADGYLSITGRKKELLVLSNGKKVVPSFIEGLLVADDFIDQAAVCGEARPFLTALIVPKWDNLMNALKSQGVAMDGESKESLCRHTAVKQLLKQRIEKVLADVSNPERVKNFHVLANPFTVAADELTVSLKLRRNVVLGKHTAALESLYREGGTLEGAMTP